jgi:hypothetical protein
VYRPITNCYILIKFSMKEHHVTVFSHLICINIDQLLSSLIYNAISEILLCIT